MTTQTITRQQFLKQFKGSDINLRHPSLRGTKLQSALKKADKNNDGKISQSELPGLFRVVDSFDRNGSSHSFKNTGIAGRTYQALLGAKAQNTYQGANAPAVNELMHHTNFKSLNDKGLQDLAKFAVARHGQPALKLLKDPKFKSMSTQEKTSMLRMLMFTKPNAEHNTLPTSVDGFRKQLKDLHGALKNIVGHRALSNSCVNNLAKKVSSMPHLLNAIDRKSRKAIFSALLRGLSMKDDKTTLDNVKGALRSLKADSPAMYKLSVLNGLKAMGDTKATQALATFTGKELFKALGGTKLAQKIPFAGPLLTGISEWAANKGKLDTKLAQNIYLSLVTGALTGAAGGPLGLMASTAGQVLDVVMKSLHARGLRNNAKQALQDPTLKP